VNKLFLSIFVVCFCTMSGAYGQYYRNAIGLRLIWGIGGTLKHFVDEKSALEGILHYRSYSNSNSNWNFIRVSGIYQVHDTLEEVWDGLAWYYGLGGFLGFWGGDYIGNIKGDNTYLGITGAIGLDFAFFNLPVNLSLDWTPYVTLSGGGGFTGKAGGLALRYIF